MPIDIFDFWKKVKPTDRIHPDDKAVFARLGTKGHGFHLRTSPGCFMGPLRTAPVVLLYLSPGRGPAKNKRVSRAEIEWHKKNRSGRAPLISEKQHAGAFRWWTSRTKCFGKSPEELSTKVAVLNIGAYGSETFNDYGLLAALPSSRVALDWAQSVLFPKAEDGERVVICLRSAEYWGLRRGCQYGTGLFTPNVNRGGHMLKDNMRAKVISAVQKVLR